MKSLILRLILTVISIVSWSSYAQFGFEYDPSIPVFRTEQYLTNPWGGGLNFTQISDFDFDFDGDMDLFLFDRSSDNIRVLLQEDSMGTPYYQTDFYAKYSFPSDVRYRATMVDYDNDGRKDLFTYGLNGLKVYRNTGDATNGISWQLVSNLLYSQYPSVYTNISVSASDIPAIVDVDFDGDIDVLTFNMSGEHIEYHQNQSVELYGIPDSLVFELKNECWGKFAEDPNSNAVVLNFPGSPCTSSAIPNPLRGGGNDTSSAKKMHSGSSVLALDYDDSGVLDLVLGDVSYTNMIMLLNGGAAPNTDSPMISQDQLFPSNTLPVDLHVFPAAFYVDVDFDGLKDLVVGANSIGISENETSIQFFKNLGTNAQPNFVHSDNNYFQKQMVEHGSGSIPVFMDYDEDGLLDMFVANTYRYIPVGDKESTIAQYRNTGTASNPEFTYVDYNFLNLDQQGLGLRTVPTFGDIDTDGDEDLLLGLEDGTLTYYQNESVGAGAIFNTPVPLYMDITSTPIDVGSFAFPQLFDLDKDGLLDLLIGAESGEVLYYHNSGSATNPQFELYDTSLGSVDVSTVSPNGYASPHFFNVGNSTRLFIGNLDGSLIYYDSIDVNLGVQDTFNLVATDYVNINVEGYSSFAINDIDGDGEFNLFVGQDLGGIFHFNANPNSSIGIHELDSELPVRTYPNPTSGLCKIEASDILSNVVVQDVNGSEILQFELNQDSVELDLKLLSSGVYILRMYSSNGSTTFRKVVKH